MFKILDGREEFFQWDINQKLIINNDSLTEVHYSNNSSDIALVCEIYELDGQRVADVPNILLQQDWPLRAYAYQVDHTLVERKFKVNTRTRPADYVYTETEVATWKAFTEEINNTVEEFAEAEARREEQERDRENAEARREESFSRAINNTEEATRAATQATNNANKAADWANYEANEAGKMVRDGYKTFANALTGVASGKAIKINDLSPLQEYIDINATAETEIDFNTVKARAFGANNFRYPYHEKTKTLNGITFTDNGDGSITLTGTPTASTNFNFSYNYPNRYNDSFDYTHLIKGVKYTLSITSDKPITGISLNAAYYKESTGNYANWLRCDLTKTNTAIYPDDGLYMLRTWIAVSGNCVFDEEGITLYPMLEVGETATAFESFVEPVEYNIEPNGQIYNFVPVGNTTTVITDNPEVNLTANYSRDINKVIARLENAMAMATMGGAL